MRAEKQEHLGEMVAKNAGPPRWRAADSPAAPEAVGPLPRSATAWLGCWERAWMTRRPERMLETRVERRRGAARARTSWLTTIEMHP